MKNLPVALSLTHPHLIDKWHPDNPPIETTSKGSMKKYKWICEYKHTWIATPCNLVKTSSCPYCVGKRPIVGLTDFATKFPMLAQQWGPKNEKSPSEYMPYSAKKVWWVCSQGHEWESTIANRTAGGNGCPFCSIGSVPNTEILLLCSMSRYGRVFHHAGIGGYEVDVYLPDLGIVAEYDGYYWHKNKIDQDYLKTMALLNMPRKVLRLRETGLPKLEISHPNLRQIEFSWTNDLLLFNNGLDTSESLIDFFQ